MGARVGIEQRHCAGSMAVSAGGYPLYTLKSNSSVERDSQVDGGYNMERGWLPIPTATETRALRRRRVGM